jgi:hypothetical protein
MQKPVLTRKKNPLEHKLADVRATKEADAQAAVIPASNGEEIEVQFDTDETPPVEAYDEDTKDPILERLEKLERQNADLRSQLAAPQPQPKAPEEALWLRNPGGLSWSERRVVNNQYVDTEYAISAFYGPFENAEGLAQFLEAKASRPMPSLDWYGLKTVTEDERLSIRRRELRDAEAAGSREFPLDL